MDETPGGSAREALRAELRRSYDRASFGGDPADLAMAEAQLAVLQADLDLARGRLLHVRAMNDHVERPEELAAFERAAAELVGDDGEAEARFWIGTYHQVVRHDNAAAEPELGRAEQLAGDDSLVQSYVQRHLGFLAVDAGRVEEALQRLTESLRLREQLDFPAGVAAAHLALADLERRRGDTATADEHLATARRIARACGAGAVLRWADALDESAT